MEYTIIALDYIKNTGIVMEGCFPYTASDQDCSDMCSDPSERISIDHWDWAIIIQRRIKKE